jgi:RES domain-containing protein
MDLFTPHPDFAALKARWEARLSEAKPYQDTAYRFVPPKFANIRDFLSGEGSRITGGRWNPKGLPVVYGSREPETAFAEVFASHRYYKLPIAMALPRVVAAFEFAVDTMFDLTGERILDVFGVALERIEAESWRAARDSGAESTGQAIGRAAWELGLQGLLVPSAERPGGTNVVLFPQRLPPDAMKIINPAEFAS